MLRALTKRIGELDQRAMRWMVRHRARFLTPFFQVITVTAWGPVWGVFVVSLASAIGTGAWPERQPLFVDLLAATIAPGVAWVFVSGMKRRWRRKRPFQKIETCAPLTWCPQDDSFPSGHTASAFGFLVVIAGSHPELAPFVALWAILIAFSRFYLGVHFPSDIAVGASIGGAVGVLVRFL